MEVFSLVLLPTLLFCHKVFGGITSLNGLDSPMAPASEENDIVGRRIMGDAIVSDEQYNMLYKKEEGFYSLISGVRWRWIDAVIYYDIDSSLYFNRQCKAAIKAAMAQWERKTCIKFKKVTNRDEPYVTFFRGLSCWAHVGMSCGAKVSCGYGCGEEHVMAHELGHVIGFFHEHNRKDRDEYVDVHTENIGDFLQAFKKVENSISYGQPYDYASVMHYPWTAFSTNGKATMTPRSRVPSEPYTFISSGDVQDTNMAYKCDKKDKAIQEMRKYAAVSTCTNKQSDKKCKFWKSQGYCKSNPFVKKNCCATCTKKACKDSKRQSSKKCGHWKSAGYCKPTHKWSSFMKKNCCATCARKVKSCGKDKHPKCAIWAKYGYCKKSDYARKNCKKSCGCKETTKGRQGCTDKSEECTKWRDEGYCYSQTGYMRKACCNTCETNPGVRKMTKCVSSAPSRENDDDSTFSVYTQRFHLGTGKLCEDSIPECVIFAKRGDCETNAEQMDNHCKKSCNELCPSCNQKCDGSGLKPQGKCATPLGLSYTGKNSNISRLPDSAFTIGEGLGSYTSGGWKAYPHNARLYQPDDLHTRGIGAWCASRRDIESRKDLSLIVDLGSKKRITHVATQGRPKYYEKVSHFKIEFSDDRNIGFKEYKENGEVKVFTGSLDNVTPAVNRFLIPIVARFMKFIPTMWNYPCIRLEYYGCEE